MIRLSQCQAHDYYAIFVPICCFFEWFKSYFRHNDKLSLQNKKSEIFICVSQFFFVTLHSIFDTASPQGV